VLTGQLQVCGHLSKLYILQSQAHNKKEKIEHLVKASGPVAYTNIHVIIILALSKYVYLEVDSDVKEWGAGMWTSF
jgi:hypothetical protein